MTDVKPEDRLFINNKYVEANSGETLSIYNPFNAALITSTVQIAGQSDIEAAVTAASTAFKTWRTTSSIIRAKCMFKMAELLEANATLIGPLETTAMGMPINNAIGVTMFSASWWRYYAGWTDKLAGDVYPDEGDGVTRLVYYEPIGVCAGIASWNATILSAAWKIAPAVAAGNTFIFKSSEKSPLGALALGRLVKEAGFPPGVINFVTGKAETGKLLASHMGISKISFTGSTEAGRMVQIAAAKSNLKSCTLELGGKSAALVFEDADVEKALGAMSSGFLMNSAQVCAATTRLLVQDSMAEVFVTKLKERFDQELEKFGDPASGKTEYGPLADSGQFDRVMGFIEDGKKDGAELITGGYRHSDAGYFVQPTIFLNPKLDSSIYRDEIFGPVLVVRTFRTEEEAVRLANDNTYGLGAAVFTKDLSRALRLSKQLEAGTVGVNQGVAPSPIVPFGGMKSSGYGRENGKEGILAYVETKTVVINTA